MSVQAIEIDGRKALAAELPGGFVKIMFEDGEIVIGRAINVKKFNPFHDEKGRFTTEGRATFISTGEKFAKTIARLRDRMKQAEKPASSFIPMNDQLNHNELINQYYPKMQEMTRAEYRALSKEEQRALKRYSNGNNSGRLNYHLGKNTPMDADDQETVDFADSAISKMRIPHDTVLFTATNLANMGFEGFDSSSSVKKLQTLVGKTMESKAYLSTTLNFNTSRGFLSSHRVLMYIEAPKGKNAAFIGGHSGETRSEYPNEGEFVLPRGSKFVVTGAKHYNAKDSPGVEARTVLTVRLL